MAEETSSSSGSSSSVSTPVVVQTPENAFLLGLGQYAQQMSEALYNWGQTVFANTSNVTDANIDRFIDTAQQAGGLAANAIQRYTGVFQPLEDQLVKDANTYASPDRIATNMGAAESGVAQNMQAQRENYERTLQSQGLDPSSGRYASLERMARTQEGAASAAAGQAAQLNTEQVGRNLRTQAIQVGQQYPAAAVNELNSAQQGIAGAQNAVLANANTGAALLGPALAALQAGFGVKLPPVGQQSASRSAQQNQAHKETPDKNQDRNQPGAGVDPNAGRVPPGAAPPRQQAERGPLFPVLPKEPSDLPDMDPFGNFNDFKDIQPDYNQFAPTADQYGAFGDTPNYTDQGAGSAGDQSWYDDFYKQYATPDANAAPTDNMDTYGMGYVDPAYDDMYGGGYEDSGDYAEGGEVLPTGGDQTQGGFVDKSMSPSGGQVTDDVNAHLNAEEFVLPRDVTRWKGEEFFHKLIAQSREARVKASQSVGGKPSARPSNGPPSFVSKSAGSQ